MILQAFLRAFKMKKNVKRGLLTGIITLSFLVGGGYAYFWVNPEFGGGSFKGKRLERMERSEQYKDGHFENTEPPRSYSIGVNIEDAMGEQVRTPPTTFPIIKPDFSKPPTRGLTAYWFGHATVLIELEGVRILTDPMLSEYAFPIKMVAPKRFNPPPISLEELPKIDIAIISHDHYDHLDMKTIQHLSKQGTQFFTGLGVGAHLQRWNVPSGQIHEMDWWQYGDYKGLRINCTPARHYSGRTSMDNSTLWTSWVIKGQEHSIFHSGDSGYSSHFKEIGEKLGPIDLSFIKIGDYGLDLGWQDIHMLPENSVQAHLDIKGSVMFPIHWGTFELSNHDWDEPIKRTRIAADEKPIRLVTPKLGEKYVFGEMFGNEDWWEELE